MTKKRHSLVEIIPPGPNALRTAEAARQLRVLEVPEARSPRTSATSTSSWGALGLGR